ncbi:hypothetical protein BK142_26810 [Paenibacillus glucanolyticus]|nr:hypothetical protein BK142_26810 [Paenibacillus glucanolyticus]
MQQVLKVYQERQVLKVYREHQVLKVYREHQVLKVYKALQVLRARCRYLHSEQKIIRIKKFLSIRTF